MGCTLYLTLVGIPSTTGPAWQKLFLDAWLLFFFIVRQEEQYPAAKFH